MSSFQSVALAPLRLALATRRGVYVLTLTPDPFNCSTELCLQRVFIENDTEVNKCLMETPLSEVSFFCQRNFFKAKTVAIYFLIWTVDL
jgi:hypothetical protein